MTTFTTADLAQALASNPDLELIGGPVAPPQRNAARVAGQSEHSLQVAVIAECDRRAATDPRYGLILAVPNGGHRSKATAGRMKAEGVRAGVPDLLLPVPMPEKGFAGCWIELKVGRNQSTPAQERWQAELARQGYFVAVVHDSVAEVIRVLSWYLE